MRSYKFVILCVVESIVFVLLSTLVGNVSAKSDLFSLGKEWIALSIVLAVVMILGMYLVLLARRYKEQKCSGLLFALWFAIWVLSIWYSWGNTPFVFFTTRLIDGFSFIGIQAALFYLFIYCISKGWIEKHESK